MNIRFWFFMLLCIYATGAYAQDVGARTRQRQEFERQIELIEKQLSSTQAVQQTTLVNLNLLKQKIDSRKLLLSEIGVQVNQINDSIKRKEIDIKELRNEYEQLELAYLQILYQAYIHRNRQIWVAYLLASDNFRQAYRRWQYFKNYARHMNQRAAQMKWASAHLDNEISMLTKLRIEAEDLKADRQKELVTLSQEERQAKQMVTKLSAQERTLRTQLQQKQKELSAVNREISRIMSETEKNRKAATPKELETDRILAASFEENKGKLPWPLNQGVITEPFGQQNHPVLKGIKMPFNSGVGITGSRGDEVHAVFQGTVKKALLLPGYSQCVIIQHGSYYTFYCKLGSVKVKVGDKVATGDVLGVLADIDGVSSLHFELWNGTNKQNPEQWLRKR